MSTVIERYCVLICLILHLKPVVASGTALAGVALACQPGYPGGAPWLRLTSYNPSYDLLFQVRPWRLCHLEDVIPMAYPFLHLQIPFHYYGFPRLDLVDRAPSAPS